MARKKTKKRDRSAMKERSRSRVRERARKTVEGKKGGIQWLTLPDDFDSKDGFFEHKKGNNKIIILPYEVSIDNHPEGIRKGDLWYEKSIQVHYGLGAGNQAKICPRTFDKKCPVCEQAFQLWDDEEEDDARQLFPKRRQVFNVLHDGQVKLWTLSFHNFGKKLEEEILYDEDQEFDGFYFLEKEDGYDIKARFVEAKIGKNKFLEVSKIDFLDRKKDLSEDLYDEVYDLDTIVECPDYKELKQLFLEEPEEEDEPEEEKEKPQRRKRRTRKRREEPEEEDVEEEEEDVEEEEEDVEEEEEEPEPPKKRKRKKKEEKKKVADDECPSGHEYGTDCDEYPDDCDDCEKWEDCIEAQDNG